MLFCLADDTYAQLDSKGRRYKPVQRLSDLEVMTLVLLRRSRGSKSQLSFLRAVKGYLYTFFRPWPGSLHPCCHVRKLPGRGVLPSGRAELAVYYNLPSGLRPLLRELLFENRSQLGSEERVRLQAGLRHGPTE